MDYNVRCPQCKSKFKTNKSSQKFCSKECRHKNWVENNRDKLNATVRRYRAKRYESDGRWREEGPKARDLKDWMVKLKSKPCADCGNKFPTCCMDFDHREGQVKEYNVGSMFAHHYSMEKIQEELDKCDLVCSNCHRIRTRDRRTGKRLKNHD